MGFGDCPHIPGIWSIPFSPIVYGKVLSPWDFGLNSIYDQMGEYGNLNYSRILKGLGQKYLFFEHLKCCLPVFYGVEIIKCKKSANIFNLVQNLMGNR